jgi:negative regulator of sigma E activity
MRVGAVRKDQTLTTSRPEEKEREEVAEKEPMRDVRPKPKKLARVAVARVAVAAVAVAAVKVPREAAGGGAPTTTGAKIDVVRVEGGEQEINTHHISKRKQVLLNESRVRLKIYRSPLRTHGGV